VPRPDFGAYAGEYSRYFATRRRDGIIELRMQTDDRPAASASLSITHGPGRQEIGNDPDNEVLILTGTGNSGRAS
jgi:hypothetical protein